MHININIHRLLLFYTLRVSCISFLNQNWSEDSEDEDDQQPLSREDSGIQVDRTPLEEPDQNRKLGPRVLWKGTVYFWMLAPFLIEEFSRREGKCCKSVPCPLRCW